MINNKLVYLISTIYPSINNLIDKLPKVSSHVDFLICCQSENNITIDERFRLRGDTKIFIMKEFGLSKSRNLLLGEFFDKYKSSYAVITDDDVGFLELSYSDINSVAEKLNANVITGRVRTPDDQFFSPYRECSFKHNSRSSNCISSIEIILSSNLSDSKIRFDQRFGLGAEYKMGEEAIFVQDLINDGYKVMYHPLDIFIHPKESTGSMIDKAWFEAKGAFYARKYGKIVGGVLLFRRMINLKICGKVRDTHFGASLISLINFK